MTIADANKNLANQVRKTLTKKDATLIYAIGVTSTGKVEVLHTSDMAIEKVHEILKKIVLMNEAPNP